MRRPKPTKLGILIALSVTAESFCPDSAAQTNSLTPGTVVAWGEQVVPYVQPGIRYQAIAAGYFHSLALRSDGTVLAWGDNGAGELILPANLTGVIAIAAGYAHSLALKSNGTVLSWGDSCCQGMEPTNLTGVIAVAAGGYHSLALKSDGKVVAWGANTYGQSAVLADLTGVTAIAGGYSHSLALKSDGTVVAWGYDLAGQDTVPASLTGVIAIAAGTYQSLALVAFGPPPALSIYLSRTNVLVEWPDAALGYRLEVTASLSAPVTWNSVTNISTFANNRHELPLPISNGAQFFRLINP